MVLSLIRSALPLAFFAPILVQGLMAQTQQNIPLPLDGGMRERLISIYISPLPAAPFTATVNTEWVRYLANGSRITLKNHRLIARDKAGRIFQERRLLVPDDSNQQSLLTQTEITDPVAHTQYVCLPQSKTCQLEERSSIPFSVNANGTPNSSSPGHESLGKQTIAGMETIGTRETVVIPTSAIGNDSPIQTTREFWFSNQLGINLLSIRDDPRFGTQKFELSDISLGDPDPALFTPPEGSKVINLRKPVEIEAPNTLPAQ